MTRLSLLALLLPLAGCQTADRQDLTKAMTTIASDPSCGHTDRIQGDIGGLGSGLHVFLERTCPAKAPSP